MSVFLLNEKRLFCVFRCLQIGQTGESHRDALLSLGVSYANELNQSRALDYLKQWLDLHPDYQRFQPSIPASDPSDQFSAHGELLQRVFAALRAHPESPELHSVSLLYSRFLCSAWEHRFLSHANGCPS
mmetsp:Transcript_45505/g.176993  ORF Transcript_45505/g.176993 Transcript_45505/m.176993 type:complete len:129 (+) Transcript_45505:1613-1999(+)